MYYYNLQLTNSSNCLWCYCHYCHRFVQTLFCHAPHALRPSPPAHSADSRCRRPECRPLVSEDEVFDEDFFFGRCLPSRHFSARTIVEGRRCLFKKNGGFATCNRVYWFPLAISSCPLWDLLQVKLRKILA